MAEAAINDNNVTVSQPVSEGGIVYVAPKGTDVPDKLTKPSALPPAFKSLGDIGEDGFTESTDSDSDAFKNMGGHTVLTVSKGKSRQFKFTFIEALRADLMRFIYGNADVDESGNLTHYELSNKDNEECVAVVYELLSNGKTRMTTLDRVKPKEFDDVEHSIGSLMSYTVTVDALDHGGKSGDVYVGVPA